MVMRTMRRSSVAHSGRYPVLERGVSCSSPSCRNVGTRAGQRFPAHAHTIDSDEDVFSAVMLRLISSSSFQGLRGMDAMERCSFWSGGGPMFYVVLGPSGGFERGCRKMSG